MEQRDHKLSELIKVEQRKTVGTHVYWGEPGGTEVKQAATEVKQAATEVEQA